ncbi:protein NOI4-like isoform X1 [Papaver somniferum]|uniref:protein NOI4-like isoform X1 n=1 Tax=Papaver somniferum TaxID=3469 RepID=UPI000E6F4901|nr:protein NOI4-like isoform X1 [Papaver somniferum]
MASQDKGRPLPKFGEWDVNNPASAEGFTVIFAKARDDKKTNAGDKVSPKKNNDNSKQQQNPQDHQYPSPWKWFCCG